MGWEYRNRKRYYYTKTRIGNKVVSQYLGNGELAELAAQLAEIDKETRQLRGLRHALSDAELADLAATPEVVVLLLAQAEQEAARMLEQAGYHQHKGEWRKKRVTKNCNEAAHESASS